MSQTVRFAVGTPEDAYSTVWRATSNRDDVYIIPFKGSPLKWSIHGSGVWVLAATSESGATFEGNRRLKQWQRPPETAPGLRVGPIVVVPHTSVGSRPVLLDGRKVTWVPTPKRGEGVEFVFFLQEPGISWTLDQGHVLIGQLALRSKGSCLIVARDAKLPKATVATVERMLADPGNQVGMDPAALDGGSLMWVTQSQEGYPVVFDLPVPIGPAKAPNR